MSSFHEVCVFQHSRWTPTSPWVNEAMAIAVSNTMDPFRHRRLGADEVRLLNVDLSDSSRDISLTVEHFHKNHLPGYQAISYTWGAKPHRFRSITLNDRPFQVTLNAFWCLHFLCKHYRRWEWLWMDYLCIDQRNISERNDQVQQMDHIYQNASLVLAWLGSDSQIQGDTCSATLNKRKCWSKKQLVYDLPYWRRIWIVKEVYFARQVLFLYGPMKTSLADFWKHTISTVDLINTLLWGADLDDGPHGVMTVYVLTGHQHNLGEPLNIPNWPKQLSLLTSFFWFKCHDCCDPRDRVFSIMGLLPAAEAAALTRYFPDYGISVERFWLIVFAHLLLWHGLCEDLSCNGRFGINLGGQPREAIFPTQRIRHAIRPMLENAKHQAQAKTTKPLWRRRRKSEAQAAKACEKARVKETAAQENLMYTIIEHFDG